MARRQEVIDIMDTCSGLPDILDPMEMFDEAKFTVDQYIETAKEFRDIYPEMCHQIDLHLDFLLGVLDYTDDLQTLQKIVGFLKNK